MILLAAEGLGNDEIAARLDVGRDVVTQWRRRFFEQRLPGLEERQRSGRPRAFPPEVVVLVKAIACELPSKRGLPLSRFSCADIAREVERSGVVATLSDKTVWRWLSEDAIRPWQHRCWIFPRDPDFAVKAGRILDLYARRWQAKPLGSNDFVISTDEKTSIQARRRLHTTLVPGRYRSMRVEHEYERCGAWAYLAALDVHRMKLFGRCEKTTGIEPFEKLVADVMNQPPYNTARRVFWIMDNGSSHRGSACVRRLQAAFRNIIPVHVRYMPAGSTRSKSTSPSSSARCSPRMTSPRSQRSKIASFVSKNITSRSPRRSNGSSPALTSTPFWHVSKAVRCQIRYVAPLENTLPNL